MGQILHLLSLIALFYIGTSSLVYENINGAPDNYRRHYHIPKAILRLGLDINPATQTIVDQDNPDRFNRYHKKYKKQTSSAEKAARKGPLVFWVETKKLLLDNLEDAKKTAGQAKIPKEAKSRDAILNRGRSFAFPQPDESTGLSTFQIDPVFNILKSGPFRRQLYLSSSDKSDEETENWKEKWQQRWLIKKYEAVNSSQPVGDHVNMVAARPWGVQCGDLKQHDFPWGSCVLAMECEAELRIYRGDIFCGRTEFVCCALQATNYDMYQAIDPSFEDQSISTDLEEQQNGGKVGMEKIKKGKEKAKKRRQQRELRKKKIKRLIAKTVREIRKILNRVYSNGTRERQRKTRMLKKFVEHLKKQYKKDRQSVKEIHGEQMLKIDTALMNRLNEIRAVNKNFMHNKTFRDIVIHGKTNEKGARMLMEAYPDLSSYFKFRRLMPNKVDDSGDYLDKDIEYGYYDGAYN